SEPWKFIVIDDVNLREELIDVATGAVAKLKTASHILIIASRINMRYDSPYLFNQMKHVQQFPVEQLNNISTQYKFFQETRNILTSEQSLHDCSAKQTY